MTHPTPPRPQGESDHTQAVDRRIASDHEALRATTIRTLPTLDDTTRAVQPRRALDPSEALIMSSVRSFFARPWAPVAVGAAVVLAALAVIPIDYSRTTGYDVRLSLAGSHLSDASVQKVGDAFMKALHATNLNTNSGAQTVLVASVPSTARGEVNAAAQAFAHELTQKGIAASCVVTPRVEHFSGNAYAALAGAVLDLNINATGKSDADIAADIRSQLSDAGFTDSDVQVTTTGGQRQVVMHMEPGAGTPSDVNVKINDDNAPAGADHHEAKVMMHEGDMAGLTDDQIAQKIVDQLHAQGVEAEVVVQNGKVVSVTKK